MDKVARLLSETPYDRDSITRDSKAFFQRQDLIKAKLKSGELTPKDIEHYNASDNYTQLFFCPTCDNISEVTKPNFYHTPYAVCFECEVI